MAEVPLRPTLPGDEEPRRVPGTDGPSRLGRSEADEEKRAEKVKDLNQEAKEKRLREEQKRAYEFVKEAKKRIEETKARGEQEKIRYKEAKSYLEAVSSLQDENPVIINPEELKTYKDLLMKHGYLKASAINKLEPAQVVVIFQAVAREVGFEEPQEEDFSYNEGENRELERKRAKSLIRQAESVDEETLNVEKVGQNLTVEEFEKAAERSGPGTMERPERKAEAHEGEPVSFIVQSRKHLAVLSQEDVAQICEAQVVPEQIIVEATSGWEDKDYVDRGEALRKNGIFNTQELTAEGVKSERSVSDAQAGSEIVYEDKAKKILVSQSPSGKYYVVGVTDLEPETIGDLLKRANIEKELKPPKDWQAMSFPEKRQWYKETGIEVVPVFSGGGTRWGDNDRISEIKAASRLETLHAVEEDLFQQGLTSGLSEEDAKREAIRQLEAEGDRTELGEHLGRLRNAEVILQNLFNDSVRGINVRGTPQMADLDSLIAFIRNYGRQNYRFVNQFNQAVEGIASSAEAAGQLAALHRFLPANVIAELSRIRRDVHDDWQRVYKAMDPKIRDRLFQRLKEETQSYAQSLRAGFYGTREVEARLAPTILEESRKELLGQEGFIEWRATIEIEGMKTNQLEALLKGPPTDWRESESHLNSILRFVESTDFTPEQISSALQRAVAIPESIPIGVLTGDELSEAKEMQDRLNRILKATQAMHTLRVTAERASLNPEAIGKVFEGFDDETFRIYFSRFAKDAYGKDFEFKDAAGNIQKFNLLDKALQEIFKRLKRERIDMNLVEELSRYDISRKLTAGELNDIWSRWYKRTGIMGTLPEVRGRLEELRKEMVSRISRRGWDSSDWATNFDRKKAVIGGWHVEANLLGVTKGKARPTPGRPMGERYFDQRRRELSESLEMILQEPVIGLTAQQIKDLRNTGLLDQVNNNAYYLAWTLAFSEYDTIRVWDNGRRDAFGNQGDWRDIVKSWDSSNWYGFHVDHLPEFYLNENRGRPNDVNQVLWKHMLGKRRKYVLPQLRFLVRTIGQCGLLEGGNDPEAWGNDPELRTAVNNKMTELFEAHRAETGLDFVEGNDEARGWASGAAIAELIMNGDDVIPFDKLNWSEVFERLDWTSDYQKEESNISKYNLIDIFDDRTQGRRYFGADHLQAYLGQPSTARFMDVNSREKFYSKRNVRIWPWMKMVLPAHREIGHYWKRWFKMPERMPLAEAEGAVDLAVQTGVLDPKSVYPLKRQMLGVRLGAFHIPGWWWLRGLRESGEATHILAKETGRGYLTSPLGMFFEFLRQLFKYSAGALGGQS